MSIVKILVEHKVTMTNWLNTLICYHKIIHPKDIIIIDLFIVNASYS